MGETGKSPPVPVSQNAFHILLALADGQRHGYSIMKEVLESTGGAVRLGSATLYRQLRQLCIDGWIEETATHDESLLGRRFYRLTRRGRSIAVAEAERLETLVSLARSRRLLAARN